MRIDWDEVWIAMLALGVAVAVTLAVTAITADHSVQGYYIGESYGHECIKGHVNWDVDITVFCSDEHARVWVTFQQLNAQSGDGK